MELDRMQDISDPLALSERRRKEAQRLSGVGFWELNHVENTLYWSEEIYAIYEISDALEPNYAIFLALTHEDDRETVDATYRGSVESGEEYRLRYRLKAGGATKWIEARGVTFYDKDGHPTRSIGTAWDISEIITAQQKVQHLAYHDGLTNLPNRRLFSDRIDMAMKQADRKGSKFAVLFIDLDNFKQINDRFGHDAGDELLQCFADRLRSNARASDTFARVGGDEFAGIMNDIDAARVDDTVQKIKRSIEGFYETQVGRFEIKVSIGVTIYPSDSEQSDILLRHADQAMYEAKGRGKSCVHYFDTQKHRSIQLRRQILLDLEVAIKEGQLELYFQPRVSLQDGKAAGAEALLRWFRPGGSVDPSSIVNAISGTHLEWALDTWVIETQLKHARVFLEHGISGPFSLNVCPSTIENSDFPAHLSSLLARSGVSGDEIEIEILEVSSIKNFERTDKILRECKKFGVGFSLDDFGTGFSSLTHFHAFAIDKLKIDKSFVSRLEVDDQSLTLVKSILAIARTNKRPVIAEGVESTAIARTLAELGCEYAQGYGISRPMPASRYIAWATTWDSRALENVARTL
ncbi:MAG: EAL domain-containing protein [Pseudomonadales bacterium]